MFDYPPDEYEQCEVHDIDMLDGVCWCCTADAEYSENN